MKNRFVKLLIAVSVVVSALICAGSSYATEHNESKPIDVIIDEVPVLYNDVDETHWAYASIKDLTEANVIHGYFDNTFKPDNYITRQEFAKLLVNIANIPVVENGDNIFADMPADNVLTPYVNTANKYLTVWKNTETGELLFNPNDKIKREDLIYTILRMQGIDVNNVSIDQYNELYADFNDILDIKKPYIAYALDNGIIKGFEDNTIRGNNYVTRAQMCIILSNTFRGVENLEYVETGAVLDYTPEPEYSYTEEDLMILAKVMYCEAGSYWITDEQQMMFGNVLLNRVASPEFPNTVREVAYQPGQYLPRLFNSYTPDQRTINNARKLLEGYRCMPSSVVFQANFPQGSGTWKAVYFDHLGYTYFCYANNMHYYQ